MSGFSRQSRSHNNLLLPLIVLCYIRFMRSMTPSASVKMSTSKFNLVCGRTHEQSVRPNLERVPNPQPPKHVDSRLLTPGLSRRDLSNTREGYRR